jgi:N-acetylornithine carbamoyltransferase
VSYLSLDHLDADTLAHLLALAGRLQQDPVRDVLRGKVLGLVFMNPSLRTLASMQAGMAQLGGSSFVIQPGAGTWALESQLGVVMDEGKAEHVREAVPVLEEYCDALGVRCFAAGTDLADDAAEPVLSSFAEAGRKPLINLESALDHPCQALADHKTLDDLGIPKDGKIVLTWAWHPRALPLAVPAAVASMAVRRGMELVVHRPEGFGMPAPVAARIDAQAALGGGSWSETDAADGLEGAHVIYAKSWGATAAYGDAAADAERRRDLRSWCVDEGWFRGAQPDAPFLHCLPVRRNVVVADEILDGPRSRVVQQAGNRLHVQKALLCHLLAS